MTFEASTNLRPHAGGDRLLLFAHSVGIESPPTPASARPRPASSRPLSLTGLFGKLSARSWGSLFSGRERPGSLAAGLAGPLFAGRPDQEELPGGARPATSRARCTTRPRSRTRSARSSEALVGRAKLVEAERQRARDREGVLGGRPPRQPALPVRALRLLRGARRPAGALPRRDQPRPDPPRPAPRRGEPLQGARRRLAPPTAALARTDAEPPFGYSPCATGPEGRVPVPIARCRRRRVGPAGLRECRRRRHPLFRAPVPVRPLELRQDGVFGARESTGGPRSAD